MNVKTLKEWIASIPAEFDEFTVITRDYENVEGTDLELLKDVPIIATFADEKTQEFCFLSEQSFKEFLRFENIQDDDNIPTE